MERFCGAIGRHVKNRRNPYAGLDRRTRDLARLQMVKLKYGLMEELSPKHPVADVRAGGVTFEDGPCKYISGSPRDYRKFTETRVKDSDYILLPPKRELEIDGSLHRKLAAALVTRYSPDNPRMKISIATASRHVPTRVRQWGQAQIRGGGDRFKCRALLKGQRHARDCTYVKVSTPLLFLYHVYTTNYQTISTKPRLIVTNVKSICRR